MNQPFLNTARMAAIAIGITACSGDSDIAGIGGSGITSSGTLTGFGSIFVNGVKFETGAATFSVDDNPDLTESDLAIGMRVTVNGTVNPDGVTGTATSVSFDDQLQGPVFSVSAIDADGTGITISVLGTTVRLNSTTTVFDISADISSTFPGPFDFDTIAKDNNVEISGFLNAEKELQATRIELKEPAFVADSSIVELKGKIAGLEPGLGTFNINGVNVDTFSVPAILDSLPGDELVEGTLVEVKGTCGDINCSPINATRVEGQTPGFDDNENVEVEGVITRYVSDSDFDIDGFPVDAAGAKKVPSTLTLGLNKEIEVEGTVVNGRLIATEVKEESGNIKIAATVADGSVNVAAGSFDLEPVPGQTITVKIDSSTQIEDEVGDFDSAALLNDLRNGDYIVVQGYDDGTGTVTACEIEREESADDVILQGRLESIDKNVSVTVLGVTFGIDTKTEFENEADLEIPQDVFIFAAPEGTFIKIKDDLDPSTNGIADEVEIEDLL